jgi:tyrosine-protein phosphatase SIW14
MGILTGILVGVGAVTAAVIGRVLYLRRDRFDHLRHLGTVTAGVLYRCGQPDSEDLAEVHARHRLRTIVSLRAGIDNPKRNAWAEPERRFCRDHGIRFVSLPSNHKNPPTQEQLQRFVDIVSDQSQRPVLVHCKRGQQRTGLFCAAYRMACEGWSAEEALAEMDALGFGLNHRRHQLLKSAIERFAEDCASTPIHDAVRRTPAVVDRV